MHKMKKSGPLAPAAGAAAPSGLLRLIKPSMVAAMEPSSSAAAAGGASVELAVDLHVAPHAHMPPKQQHLLSTVRLAANNSAWRLLGARPRTSHLSSARTCWQVPGRG